MPHKEFVRLIEENLYILDRLGDRLKAEHSLSTQYSRQQLATVSRLYLGGPAKLKDIARREGITAPNLCACFRKLEKEGMVRRKIDEKDRRNTWYAVTPAGEEVSRRAIEKLREGIEVFFSDISCEDEKKLVGALRILNEIFKKNGER
ncbi:MAG: MarR family transcriptional regulator [Rickettsiales bacterium]|jgi:DNA-binding MarR family transcriptional regulator|nr:MarR family transcriptional regulator [Rickettsiales bacterium]